MARATKLEGSFELQLTLLLEATLVAFWLLLAQTDCVIADSAADVQNKIAFNTHCRMCHSIKPNDNRLGPSLYGIFGAEAGQVEGYGGYSGGLNGLVWDEQTLDGFIADPSSIARDTNMIFPPVSDPLERYKIIKFLASLKNGKD